jgi:hypothetical protein
MDKKKKISVIRALLINVLLIWAFPALAQDVDVIRFGDKHYEYSVGNDSITLFLKVLGSNGKRCNDVYASDLRNHFDLIENEDTIQKDKWRVNTLTDGQRIPSDFTVSVLVDLSIPQSGKKDIFEAVQTLIESTHDSCVYLSFFGDYVSNSRLVTKKNYKEFEDQFNESAQSKYFYSALYAKLTEFNREITPYDDSIKAQNGYRKDERISQRAAEALDKNLLFVFTEGNKNPTYECLNFGKFTDYQGNALILPKVYAFFYDAGNGIDPDMESTLKGVTHPKDSERNPIQNCQGNYMKSDSIKTVLHYFEQAIRNEMYDFSLTYQVPQDRSYSGKVNYTALWDGVPKGTETFSIGTPEKTWPIRNTTASDSAKKYLIALVVAFLTILLFIAIMKIIIPGIKSKVFAAKHYEKFKVMENVKTMICPMCRREIQPGDKVVTKCRHIMHVRCWKANDYKCVEYGQNCKDGIQEHIQWNNLFSKETLRDCFLTIMGIVASLVSWIIYELTGRGFFNGLAKAFVNAFFNTEGQSMGIVNECIAKVSSFLTIGLLLGFFLSFVFRLFDGVKRRSFAWFLEITGLSLLSSIIGMAAFAIGSVILCLWVSPADTYIPWYCSFPAYLLFSVCISLSLTIKSTIPFKSALLGGLVSAIIGFIVLYFSNITPKHWDYMNMLLDFVIYGGGLGASLITVRMLAEKYFLVVKNGIRNGLRIPIHKWMNAGNKVTIGMTQQCEIQMAWEKSNKVAKEHVQLYVNQSRSQAMLRPLAATTFNMRTELNPSNKPVPLFNGDTFKIGDTIFQYVEN